MSVKASHLSLSEDTPLFSCERNGNSINCELWAAIYQLHRVDFLLLYLSRKKKLPKMKASRQWVSILPFSCCSCHWSGLSLLSRAGC